MKPWSTTTRWILLGALLAAPYAVLIFVGGLWLIDHRWFMVWVIVNAIITVIGWYLVRQWRMRIFSPPPKIGQVEPDPHWSQAGEEAWRDVVKLAIKMENEDIPLDDPQQIWLRVRQVLEMVARRYHPDSRHPALEIPVPYVLRVVELVAADMRVAFSANVPGSHIMTLNDFQRMRNLWNVSQRFYSLYRVVRMGLDPVTSLIREAQNLAGGRLVNDSAAEVKRWGVGYAIRKTGYYAIQLYSGQLVLDNVAFEEFVSTRSRQDALLADQREEALTNEPLRLLVIGQVKAGKSSLINALFGETRAAVDVVPCTAGVTPYVLERDGIQRALILDTAGTSEGGARGNPFAGVRTDVLASDLVLVTCSATSAARLPDRQLLDGLRALFDSEPTRIMPPVVVALTHVDQLRPWQEWNPPYDLTSPTDAKAKNIVAAIQAVADDLQVPTDNVVPVCLLPERIYNVEDALVPAILQNLSEAQRAKYQRCLRQFHDEQYWRGLWEQAANTGRLLKHVVGTVLKK